MVRRLNHGMLFSSPQFRSGRIYKNASAKPTAKGTNRVYTRCVGPFDMRLRFDIKQVCEFYSPPRICLQKPMKLEAKQKGSNGFGSSALLPALYIHYVLACFSYMVS